MSSMHVANMLTNEVYIFVSTDNPQASPRDDIVVWHPCSLRDKKGTHLQ